MSVDWKHRFLRALLVVGLGWPEGVAELAVARGADGAGTAGEASLARPADGASFSSGTFNKSCVKSTSKLRNLQRRSKLFSLFSTPLCKSILACLNFCGLAPASLSNQPQPAKSAIFGKIGGKIGGKTINLAGTVLHNGEHFRLKSCF